MLLLGCGGREKTQVVVWLLLVWDGKWAVRLLERDVVTGVWRGIKSTGSVVVIISVGWKVGSEITAAGCCYRNVEGVK